MKKFAFSALLAATLLGASDFNYEVTPVMGYLWNSTSNQVNSQNGGATGGVQDHSVYGVELQSNAISDLIKPELSILHGRNRVNGATDATGVWSAMLNGVYEFENSSVFTPFAKAGVGYEMYTNNHTNDYDGLLVDAGLGTKIGLTKNIALKLEGLYMYKMNSNAGRDGSNGEVHNIAALAGLNIAFGEKVQPAAPAPVAAPVVAEVVTPKPAPVVAKPAPVVAAPQDSDKDGVLDSADKCPGTPAGFKVDADGCPLKATLHLNFSTDSNKVDAEGAVKVNAFAAFLKESSAYKATIVGHTDSTASDAYNQKLSEKRAEKVKSMLIEQGVAADRLSAKGEGEKMPIASNKTKAGRAENRRIDVDLCK
ncbi:OmpA family protein [Sulfuricurvum sp.]|uniref:OmpA family protein n=1 Tax=Sulfuricurvum sp. TaxID=2025608 RepID=UPI00356A650D